MQNLMEVKKDNEGFGILIEKDAGFIDLKDPRNEKIVNELNNLNTNIKDIEIVDRFKVFAVLQKFGIKNANGRIYPE